MISRDERRRYRVPGGIPQQTMHNQTGQVFTVNSITVLTSCHASHSGSHSTHEHALGVAVNACRTDDCRRRGTANGRLCSDHGAGLWLINIERGMLINPIAVRFTINPGRRDPYDASASS